MKQANPLDVAYGRVKEAALAFASPFRNGEGYVNDVFGEELFRDDFEDIFNKARGAKAAHEKLKAEAKQWVALMPNGSDYVDMLFEDPNFNSAFNSAFAEYRGATAKRKH
jgi:hypothetical protein